ncbi:MAG TPA: hypothetical protein VGI30_04475 [Caulobacteraceae bacterium]
MGTMPSIASLVVALGLSLFGGQKTPEARPSSDEIAFVETRIRLPDDAPGPLSNFERYYAWTVGDDGKRVIYGELIFVDLMGAARPPDRKGHFHAVDEKDMPTVANGGCGVITFYLDLRSGRRPALYCNAVGASP